MGLWDDLTGKSARKANEANKGFGINMSQALKNWNDDIFKMMFQAIEQGYGGAFGEIDKIGRGAKDDILRREQGTLGRLQQDLMSRGLGNTTMNANLQRGVVSDTNRDLNNLSEQLAGIRSGLFTQQGQDRASTGQAYSNALQNIMHNRMGFIGNYQHTGGGLGETLGGLGKLFGGIQGAG